MIVNLSAYHENKPHRLKRIIWAILNRTLYRVLWHHPRRALLKLFGARMGVRCLFYRSATFFAPWNLECGDEVCFGPRVEVYNKDKVVIGNQVIISQDAYLGI